ncbi:MAG: aldehyde:ferredoxin oxidoreductase, partial [Firmicutes bacterium]|nr:aldehyde:ferredoxin oxidoreductase [Bacillota bacterium]
MATKYGGYMGKVMLINLSNGRIREYPWTDEDRRLYYGGKTMAAKIIGDNLCKNTKPLSEENMLVITT